MSDNAAEENVMLPKVAITLDGYGNFTINIDGVEISGVHEFMLRSEFGQPPRLDLTIVPSAMTIEARALLVPHVMKAMREGQ